MLRRLPVYLLLDCSESMAGPPLEAVEAGVASMLMALRKNPYAMETVHMSVITFDAKARQIVPLTEICSMAPPRLTIRPGTRLGEALSLLADSMRREVVPTTPESKGDYRPLVFILTDGQPTDEWGPAAERLRETRPRAANVYGIGCGDEVDFATLGRVADVCIHMRELSPEAFARFFVWMSASVQSMSIEAGDRLNLDKVPPGEGLYRVEPGREPAFVPGGRLFFHVKCRTTGKPYLMRYARADSPDAYIARDAHPLPEDFLSDGAMPSPSVSSDMLYGVVDCPHCGNDGWARCGCCEGLFCDPAESNDPVECPHCGASLTFTGGGDFAVRGSSG